MVELNLVGGHVALDLINTVDPRTPDHAIEHEHLPDPPALLAWARRAQLLTTQDADLVATAWESTAAAEAALESTLGLRETAYEAILALLGTIPDADATLDRLHQHWSTAVGHSTLRLAPEPTTTPGQDRLYVGTEHAMLIPDRLAHATVELLRTLDTRQLKACPITEGGCGFVFLDHSRNQTRRWCSMDDCGARAKARRLTQRRRNQRARRSNRVAAE